MQEDIVAVFPLPNVIFFPHTELPLHIFEPRYRAMVADTLQNQQLIGMFLLQPGWQDDYYGNPPIFSIGCAGEMHNVESLSEGKFNIMLRGITRVQALEMVQEYPYRKARVQILPEILSTPESKVEKMKKRLIRDFQFYGAHVESRPLREAWDFSKIVNEVASVLPLDLGMKRKLLEENDLYVRARIVAQQLAAQVAVLKLTGRFAHLRPTDPNRN